jgi:tetratricopeptide (TPR) repeat protein
MLASQGGINLWIGNNPQADGMSARLPGFSSWRNEDVDAALARQYGRRLRPAEQDRVFRAKALDFMLTQPLDAAKLFAKKIYFFFQGYEIRNDRDLDSLRERSAILRLPLPDFGWIAPLALAGVVFTRRRWREIMPLLATGATIALGVSLFFVCARYRMAAWPAFLPLAGAGVAGLVERGVPPVRRAGRALLVAGLALLAGIDFLDIRDPDPSQPRFQYGNVYARVGEFGEAEREFRAALAIAPEFGEAHHHLGALFLEQGRHDEALAELREGVRLLPESFRARRSLAEALEATGRWDEAIRQRQEILELSAGDLEDVHALARALGTTGRYPEAWALFEQALAGAEASNAPEDPWLLLNAGQTALALGEESKGISLLRRAQAHGEVRDAAIEAIALYSITTRRYNDALSVLSDALLDSPDNARLIRLRAAARFTKGDATGALEDLEHLLRLDPNDADAKRRMEEIRNRVGDVSPITP